VSSSGTEQLIGLCFDKMVFDYIVENQKQDRHFRMCMKAAEKALGLSDHQIRRALTEIRTKGYIVMGHTTRRTWANDFVICEDKAEYMKWRDGMVGDIGTLQAILAGNDAAASAKFGAMEKQDNLF